MLGGLEQITRRRAADVEYRTEGNAMRTRRLLVAVVLGAACREGTDDAFIEGLVDGLCDARAACVCPSHDTSLCVSEENERIGAAFDEARRRGLTEDEMCIEARLAGFEVYACESVYEITVDQLTDYWNANPCASFHGSAAIGEPCTTLEQGFGSDCARGLYCRDERCESWPHKPTVGEPCEDALRACAADSTCVASSDGSLSCIANPREGDPCIGSDSTCAPGFACADGITCQLAPAIGEPCFETVESSNRCRSEASCVDVTCQARGQLGEACSAGSCLAGLFCSVESAVCSAAEPSICGPAVP